MKNLESEKDARIDYRVYQGVEIGPTSTVTGNDEKEYVVVSFEELNTTGVISHSKLINKAFFDDTHSRIFKAAEEARDSETPSKLKVEATLVHAECAPYYVVIDGERQKRADGSDVIAETVTLFLIKDEKFITEYKRALRRLDFVDATGEGVNVEDQKAKELSKK